MKKLDTSHHIINKHLIKPQNLHLTKHNPNIHQIQIPLPSHFPHQPIHLHTQLFLLNQHHKLFSPNHLIYYHHHQTLDPALRHLPHHQ
ncbi:TerD family protein, partial [Bacillus pumilus]|uniref:TerD family protein n=1 Tax=Bacillus pumilus TaxID=1408 RepID=UPI0028D7E562